MNEPQLWTLAAGLLTALTAIVGFSAQTMRAMSKTVSVQMESVRELMAERFSNVDRQFDQVDRQLERLDQRVGRIETRVDDIDRDVQTIAKRIFPKD